MPFTTSSTYMLLPVPVVGSDPGPQYAQDINNCLTIIDLHDHSPGYGVSITPTGLNINTDLTFNDHSAIDLYSARFQAQTAVLSGASDLGCLYVVNDDLYYNDGVGNNVRITQSGAVAGTPGSIANLVSPASASYVSADSTFVWQSAANTPANMDFAAALLRNLTANSKALTLQPPAAMAADYTITLPTLPASQKFVTLDASGNMSAPWAVDNSTIEVSSNIVQVKALGITSAQLAANSVIAGKIATDAVTTTTIAAHNVTIAKAATRSTGTTVSAGGLAISSSSSNFSTQNGGFVDITNLSVTITTTGNPVYLAFISDASGTASNIYVTRNSGGTVQADIKLLRDSTEVGKHHFQSSSHPQSWPSSSIVAMDTPTAGTYTYKAQASIISGTGDQEEIGVQYVKLIAYEIF